MRPVDGALTEGGFGSQLTSIPYSYLVRKNWSIFALVAVFSTALLLTVPSGSLLSSGIQGSDVSTESSISKFTADMTDPKVLNVHVVPHTHDDVGWLKTVDQYYFGLNNSIQHASVHDILDSVVASLLDNPSRTFTYVEQKFFSMWWERQNDAVKDAVRFLVGNKQLGFVNGGWCMHDEATTHFMGMIDQTTLGHTFLKKELSVVPSVGWQLDPFGHSATQASLMTSKVGFDALYFGRIDYQDLELRRLTRECEGLWNSTGGGGGDSTIFWGLTGSYGGNYGAPNGFCFDQFCHDPDLTKINNLSKAIVDFLHKIRRQSDETKGNHIMLTMGSDFQYEIARRNFASLDVLIGSVMDFQLWEKVDIPSIFGPRFDRVQIFYSSPEYYTECKFNEMKSATPEMRVEGKRESISHKDMRYSVKQDDFFPYSDCPDCFWTGYFTSRTGLKRQERVASSFLMAARQIESLIDYTGKTDPIQCTAGFRELEDALGVVQHHDGVSGTAKQHVANDYAKRVQGGINRVEKCTARKFKRLFFGVNASKSLGDLSHCQLLNETICEVSQVRSGVFCAGPRTIFGG
jgi:alpha-mannosidase